MARQWTYDVGIEAARGDHRRLYGDGLQGRPKGRRGVDEDRLAIRPRRQTRKLSIDCHRSPGKGGGKHAEVVQPVDISAFPHRPPPQSVLTKYLFQGRGPARSESTTLLRDWLGRARAWSSRAEPVDQISVHPRCPTPSQLRT